ncbi:hypothetical protein MMC19_003073 [Ptychographa xylographoides]|nr:hypothetical protein [Ptychographa xylographoides]
MTRRRNRKSKIKKATAKTATLPERLILSAQPYTYCRVLEIKQNLATCWKDLIELQDNYHVDLRYFSEVLDKGGVDLIYVFEQGRRREKATGECALIAWTTEMNRYNSDDYIRWEKERLDEVKKRVKKMRALLGGLEQENGNQSAVLNSIGQMTPKSSRTDRELDTVSRALNELEAFIDGFIAWTEAFCAYQKSLNKAEKQVDNIESLHHGVARYVKSRTDLDTPVDKNAPPDEEVGSLTDEMKGFLTFLKNRPDGAGGVTLTEADMRDMGFKLRTETSSEGVERMSLTEADIKEMGIKPRMETPSKDVEGMSLTKGNMKESVIKPRVKTRPEEVEEMSLTRGDTKEPEIKLHMKTRPEGVHETSLTRGDAKEPGFKPFIKTRPEGVQEIRQTLFDMRELGIRSRMRTRSEVLEETILHEADMKEMGIKPRI